jgi:hypothetical protein
MSERRKNMTYDGTMVMPYNCVAVVGDEMEYVSGGALISHSVCYAVRFAVGLTATTNIAVITSALASGLTPLIASFNAIPVVGQIISLVGVAYIAMNIKQVAEAFMYEIQRKKGIEVTLGWYFVVPYPKFTAV